MKQRKGQLGGLTGVIFTVIFVAILLVAGFLIVQEFLDLDEFVDNAFSVVNETSDTTGIYANATGYTLATANDPGFNSPTITALFNYTDGTAGTIVGLGNVSVDEDGVITNGTSIEWANLSVSYSYNRGEEAFVGINDTMKAIGTVPTLLGLLILIVIVGIVLAIIMSIVPGTRTSGA